ncbi:MAG: AhpC/TSA family protein [Dysgonamonadaceae bacterium]|jgi:peroxiredoxin|nr:AhpC/TSA family protein [Dysgonamonadaceae bacterium]
MKKIIISGIFYSLFFLFISCENKKQEFTICGEISGDTTKMLYLEHIGTSKITILDSAELKSGAFKFKRNRPAVPDFYRLRWGNQIINLAIDSTETIIVHADGAHFAQNYTLEGDITECQKIKELTLLQLNTSQKYNDLQRKYNAGEISIDQYQDEAYRIINHYKTTAKEYIISNFLATSSYFAVFQQINNIMIFDIYDKNDNKLFGAIANAWNITYPESLRAIQLKNLFTSSRAALRKELPIEITEGNLKTLFDISLPSIDGKELRLSDISHGKITLIDFTAYATKKSPLHNLQLAEIYNKYKAKGLEIYQISLDSDEHFWKNAVINLPWVCVIDPESFYSSIAQKYNVINIPTAFILNREGEIVLRIEDYTRLDTDISKYLN